LEDEAILTLINTTNINGHDISSVFKNIVTTEDNVTFSQQITFANGIEAELLNSTAADMDVETINGVSLQSLDDGVLKTVGNQTFEVRLLLTNTTVENLDIIGTVDGLTIPDSLVTKHSEQDIHGKYIISVQENIMPY